MIQLVARALPDTLLFREHAEARALWDMLLDAFPKALALVLMPNHLHLDLPHLDPDDRLADVMSGFARWRNHHRGTHGPVWSPHPEARVPADDEHARRLRRYTHLNPSRAGLVRDPLAWPWSLHRDHVGLGPPGRTARDPKRLHAYVSGDPSAAVAGTPLPTLTVERVSWTDIVHAACGILRAPAAAVRRKGTARILALRTAWAHELRDLRALAAHVGIDPTNVARAVRGVPVRGGRIKDPLLQAAVTVVGDRRFRALEEGDLVRGWRSTKYGKLK